MTNIIRRVGNGGGAADVRSAVGWLGQGPSKRLEIELMLSTLSLLGVDIARGLKSRHRPNLDEMMRIAEECQELVT